MLEVKGLRFGYVLGQDIIDNVDFSIGEGEFIAIGGRNGCGKTTVTRLLMGLENRAAAKFITTIQILRRYRHQNGGVLSAMYSNSRTVRCSDLPLLKK